MNLCKQKCIHFDLLFQIRCTQFWYVEIWNYFLLSLLESTSLNSASGISLLLLLLPVVIHVNYINMYDVFMYVTLLIFLKFSFKSLEKSLKVFKQTNKQTNKQTISPLSSDLYIPVELLYWDCDRSFRSNFVRRPDEGSLNIKEINFPSFFFFFVIFDFCFYFLFLFFVF